MEWNGIEWGGTDNPPHFFLLILRASESFFVFFCLGGGGGVEFNSEVEVRSYALPVSNRMSPIFWLDVKPEMIMLFLLLSDPFHSKF